MTSIEPDAYDRITKLLVDAGDASSFEDAEATLAGYRLQIYADSDACGTHAGQAALATAVNTATRAVHGNVHVVLVKDGAWHGGGAYGGSLSSVLAGLGGKITAELQEDVPTIALTSSFLRVDNVPVVYPLAGQWVAGISTVPEYLGTPSVLAAVLAAALAVSECFQWLRGFPVAGDRRAGISIWQPDADFDSADAEGPQISELPGEAWLLGLGHLGQAYAWLLGLLSYGAGRRRLVLQDDDRLSAANRATSMLGRDEAVGTPKTRLTAATLERAGWETTLIERRYLGGPLYVRGDPMLLLAGVDNRDARRLLDETGFSAIYDAGLGAGPDGYLDMAIRRLPDKRPSAEIWPPGPIVDRGAALLDTPAYRDLADRSGDRCGVELLAGRTVATAFVGVTAAAWVLGSVLRELHGGQRFALIDYSLRQPGVVQVVPALAGRRSRIATVPCKDEALGELRTAVSQHNRASDGLRGRSPEHNAPGRPDH